MHIFIVEKDVNGRNMLNRMLKMEGYAVSIAESGNHAIGSLKETRTNIVLINVFQCLHPTDVAPEQKLTVRQIDVSKPTLLFTCGDGDEELDELTSPAFPCCDTAFDLLPIKVKSGMMNRILHMCNALKRSSHLSHPNVDFSWERFTLLMDLPTEAYLGCRLLR